MKRYLQNKKTGKFEAVTPKVWDRVMNVPAFQGLKGEKKHIETEYEQNYLIVRDGTLSEVNIIGTNAYLEIGLKSAYAIIPKKARKK